MNSKHHQIHIFLMIVTINTLIVSTASAQVRTKKPDRDTYNPVGAPTTPHDVPAPSRQQATGSDELIEPVVLKPLPSMVPRGQARMLPAAQPPRIQRASFDRPLVGESVPAQLHSPQSRRAVGPQLNPPRSEASAAAQERLIHSQTADPSWIEDEVVGSGAPAYAGEVYLDEAWHGDSISACDQYGGMGCDGYYACDGGCDSCGYQDEFCNASLSFDPCRWFASVELLLLFREGDGIPSLVTTSPAGTAGGTAGRLPGATSLAGGENLFDELTAGGRVTLGTWLDSYRNRSLVFRGWTAAESDYSYNDRVGINEGRILAVPTTVAGAANAALIAFPDSTENFGRFGSVGVSASSKVYGGDISVRQFWTGGLGTTFDVLYGYQFMRLEEDLQLSTSSTKTQDPFPDAVGSTLTTSDAFIAKNEFHGGQFGFAGRYREGCWSFDWLGKVGFGQVNRQAERRGRSVITTDTPPPAINDTGLLVTDGNRGSFSSSTFGWVPEFDVSIGWHKYPRFDVTFGYNVVAMTDAVRLSGVMDPVNSVDAPRAGMNYETFVLQGMHFGIRHVY